MEASAKTKEGVKEIFDVTVGMFVRMPMKRAPVQKTTSLVADTENLSETSSNGLLLLLLLLLSLS